MARPRELKVKYGAYEVSRVNGQFIYSNDFYSSSLSFNFIVSHGTASGFQQAQRSAVDAFKLKFQPVLVTIPGNQTLIETGDDEDEKFQGFNAMATLSKIPNSPWNTGRSVEYACNITWDNTAVREDTDDGHKGLREYNLRYNFETSNILSFSLQGTYTRYLDEPASKIYEEEIGEFIDFIKETYFKDIPLEIINKNLSQDEEDNLISFEITFSEAIFQKPGGDKLHPAIKNQSFSLNIAQEEPGDSYHPNLPVSRLLNISVGYSCNVDKEITKDLVLLYETEILPFIITQVENKIGSSTIAMVAESRSFDLAMNTINVGINFISVSASKLVEFKFSITYDYSTGIGAIPLWDNRNLFTRYVFQGPASITCTINEEASYLSEPSGKELGGSSDLDEYPFMQSLITPESLSFQGDDINWFLVRRTPSRVTHRLGLEPATMNITNLSRASLYEGFVSPQTSSPSGPTPPGVIPGSGGGGSGSPIPDIPSSGGG